MKQEEDKKEKYNPDDIFKKKNIHKKEEKQFQMIEYKESLWEKIMSFINNKFGKKLKNH